MNEWKWMGKLINEWIYEKIKWIVLVFDVNDERK